MLPCKSIINWVFIQFFSRHIGEVRKYRCFWRILWPEFFKRPQEMTSCAARHAPEVRRQDCGFQTETSCTSTHGALFCPCNSFAEPTTIIFALMGGNEGMNFEQVRMIFRFPKYLTPAYWSRNPRIPGRGRTVLAGFRKTARVSGRREFRQVLQCSIKLMTARRRDFRVEPVSGGAGNSKTLLRARRFQAS